MKTLRNRTRSERGHSRRTLAWRSGLSLGLLLVSACGTTEEPGGGGGTVVQQPPVMAGDSSTNTPPAVGASDGGAPKPSLDAGNSVQPEAGATGMDATSTPSSNGDAGTAADTGATTTGEGGAEGGAPSGPLPLPDPVMVGPYAVKEIDNVGKGFENPIASDDQGEGGVFCTLFVSGFTSDQKVIDEYSKVPAAYKMDLYTLFYPEGAPGQRFPVLSWANGTCAHTVGYADMIKHIVSHGFIVIAPHSRFTNGGAAQKRGIDWVLTQDTAADSPLFGHVDKDKVGVFGHSQGGGSTGTASADPRVKTSVLMHGGSGSMLHAPALFLTGDGDLNPSGVRSQYDGARVPAAFGSLKMSNHVTMMEQAERMAPEVLAWFRYQLLKDEVAKKWFVGSDCLLCKDSEWVYAQKNLM